MINMLINKIPCLDAGYVALFSCSNSSAELKKISDMMWVSPELNAKLVKLGSMTLLIKCPLFVQIFLSQFNFSIVPINNPNKEEIEAYLPNPGEIGGSDFSINRLIADDIKRTTDALLINPKAYQADGCDKFISQIISPISVYTTIMVYGRYSDWKNLVEYKSVPEPIEAYKKAIKQIFEVEW